MSPYYQDKWATIYLGDCRDVAFDLPVYDLLMADPPYGVNFAGQPTTGQRKAGMVGRNWDDKAFDSINEIRERGNIQCIWGGNYFPLPKSRGWLSWIKPDAPPSMGTFELAWTNQNRNCRHIIHSIAATNKERVDHPTQKPLRVMLWALSQYIFDNVLDPFMGSGTTLVAAKQMNKKCVGIELEEAYAEIAARRLSQEVFDFRPVEISIPPAEKTLL